MVTSRAKRAQRVSSLEYFISSAIIGLLTIIALVLYLVQGRINPAVINLTLVGNESGRSTLAGTVDSPIIPIPSGLQAMSAPEVFIPDTLSDKINGKAELYLSAGFVELRTQRFQQADDESAWFELFLYDMGTPSNAFAVFSVQRRRDVEKLPLTQNAYGTPNAVFFTTGPYYVEMIAAFQGPSARKVLVAAAEVVLDQRGGDSSRYGETIGPEKLFPTEGLIADTMTLIAQDVFGFSRLDQVYTAQYQMAEMELTLFVSHRGSSQEADRLAAAYQDFLIEFGGETVKPSPGVLAKGAIIVAILDSFEVIFSKGPFMAGVHMADNKVAAVAQAAHLYRHIEALDDVSPIEKGSVK